MTDFEQVVKHLKEYKEKYGNCVVPRSYITEDGIHLGVIVKTIRNGNRKTSNEQKTMLNSLGFVWKVYESSIPFEKAISLLEEYKENHGNCLVPRSYVTEEGIHLGRIVQSIRNGNRKTSNEQKDMLNSLGFVWNANEGRIFFEQVIKLLQEYKEKHGNCLVPQSYITEEGIRLGMILNSIRLGRKKITPEQKAMLDSLGFVWKVNEGQIFFEQVIKLLQEYKEKHGNCLVPQSYITEEGIRLGTMVNSIRSGRKKITPEQKAILDSLGFVWKVNVGRISFEQVIRLLQEYKEKHGDCLVPRSYTTEDGIHLGRIVNTIRNGNRKTNTEEKAMLDSLGFVWRAQKGRRN